MSTIGSEALSTLKKNEVVAQYLVCEISYVAGVLDCAIIPAATLEDAKWYFLKIRGLSKDADNRDCYIETTLVQEV